MQEFLTQTHSKFITVDEETAAKLFGDDFINYNSDFANFMDQQGQTSQMVPVNIYLIWPE